MIIKAGDNRIKLPEGIESHTAEMVIYADGDPQFNPGSYAIMISHHRATDVLPLMMQDEQILGTPNRFAIHCGDEILLYPMPEKEYYAQFRYCPAMKVI